MTSYSKHNLPIVTIGLDACKGGWVVMRQISSSNTDKSHEIEVISNLKDLVLEKDFSYCVGIDIPIGLLDKAQKGGRRCDQEARSILKWPRSSSVFSPPVRSALSSNSYEEALIINRNSSSSHIGISKQAYYIIPRIIEADIFSRNHVDSNRVQVFEIHPELSFLEMAGRTLKSKHTKEGRHERKNLLAKSGIQSDNFRSFLFQNNKLKEDDLLDAGAVFWSTKRIGLGQYKHTGFDVNQKDSEGLAMRIHW